MCSKFFKKVWDALNPDYTPPVIPEDKIVVMQRPRCPVCEKPVNILKDCDTGCKCVRDL